MMINLNSRGVRDMTNKNFKWLANDIDSSIVLKVINKEDGKEVNYGSFCVKEILETDGDVLDVTTANIDDLTNLLTLGIVRFTRIDNNGDILDIPFRNLYLLYKNASVLGVDEHIRGRLLSFKELELFSVIGGKVRDDLSVFSCVIMDVSDELREVMEISSAFGGYGMQEKFDALTKITMINHRRLIEDERHRFSK